jgi:hypothetical protein
MLPNWGGSVHSSPPIADVVAVAEGVADVPHHGHQFVAYAPVEGSCNRSIGLRCLRGRVMSEVLSKVQLHRHGDWGTVLTKTV